MYSKHLKNLLINAALSGASRVVTFPTNYWLGLIVDDPSAGVIHEIGNVTANGYARVAYDPGVANWTATDGSVTSILNLNLIQFPDPTTGHWFYGSGSAATPIKYAGLFDASTAGNLWFYAELGTPKTISQTDFSPRYTAGTIKFEFDV